MPGVRDVPSTLHWFEEAFGFQEAQDGSLPAEALCSPSKAQRQRLYTGTKSRFRFSDGVLVCRGSGARFHVGTFEVLSVEELHERCSKAKANANAKAKAKAKVLDPYASEDLGRLSFRHIIGGTRDLHLDPANAGAVFQVASLFNCLETSPPSTLPEDGVTRYAQEATQGATCAIACPAATIFRNYFVNGVGQFGEHQLDLLAGVGEVFDNAREGYWRLEGGHCMPKNIGSITRLARRLRTDLEVEARARQDLGPRALERTQVGVQWDTEVSGGGHRVCQVFCSALPVGLVKQVRASEWEPLAVPLLQGAYDATLAAAATLAARRGTRVRVFLTLVGAGSLGNRRRWILEAIERALVLHQDEPLEVVLVHSQRIPQEPAWQELEYGREPRLVGSGKHRSERLDASMKRHLSNLEEQVLATGSASIEGLNPALAKLDADHDGRIDGQEIAALVAWSNSNAGRTVKAFATLDINGDGVLDKSELIIALQALNAQFFTDATIDILVDEADADGDGEIHYTEFCAWLYGEDPVLMNRMLGASTLYDVK